MRFSFLLVFLGPVVTALACGTSNGGPTTGVHTPCTPGQQVNCGCPGGDQGIQVCNDAGSGFETCDCGDAAVVQPGFDATTHTDGSSGSSSGGQDAGSSSGGQDSSTVDSPATDGGGQAPGIACQQVTTMCTCTAGNPNTTLCDESSFGSALCCAEPGWPSSQTSCMCSPFGCTAGTGTCTCGSNQAGATATSCTPGPLGVCCAAPSTNSCYCAYTPLGNCQTGETKVAKCDVSAIKCIGSWSESVSDCR
jgi:hypothetical protein